MKVIIDGVESQWDFPEPKTLHDAILEIGEKCMLEERRSICELKLGEMADELDKKLTPKDVPASKIFSITITTEPIKDSLLRETKQAEEYLQKVQENFTAIPGHLVSGETDVAMTTLKESLDILIWFFNTIQQSFMAEILEPHTLKIDGLESTAYIERFNEHLQSLMQAIEQKDNVLINDYLEYELGPMVEKMKESLPEIISTMESAP